MKRTAYTFYLLFFCGFGIPLSAQISTTTLIPDINASGGITIDTEGNIYLSDFGPGNAVDSNAVVYKIDKDDFSVSVFADGFIGASGSCFDSQGNFYQAK